MNGRDDVQIGTVVRNAIIFNVNKWRDEAMNTDKLFAEIERLFSLLAERGDRVSPGRRHCAPEVRRRPQH
jgi:hypothetical protein